MTPAPVTLTVLRQHFKETYGFNPTQIETMVKSSAKSLDQVVVSIREAQKKESPQGQMADVFHGLKGLLLNMGQKEWASYVLDIEQKLKAGISCDTERVVVELHIGLAEVFSCSESEEDDTISSLKK